MRPLCAAVEGDCFPTAEVKLMSCMSIKHSIAIEMQCRRLWKARRCRMSCIVKEVLGVARCERPRLSQELTYNCYCDCGTYTIVDFMLTAVPGNVFCCLRCPKSIIMKGTACRKSTLYAANRSYRHLVRNSSCIPG